jgi:predicted acyltransferase
MLFREGLITASVNACAATQPSSKGDAMRQHEGPLPPTERIFTLDVVRGFTLLGILIMNMPGFANSFFV